MKIVLSRRNHRNRLISTAIALSFVLLSLIVLYAYDAVSSSSRRSPHAIQWVYHGPARHTGQSNLESIIDVRHTEDVPSHTVMPNYSSQHHLVSSSQVRRILTTMAFSATCNSTTILPKLILLWTSFFDSWEYFPRRRFEHCPKCTNCKVTTNRNRLLESDAIIFHCRDMTLLDVPRTRLPHQRWVFYCLESPVYSNFPGMDFMHSMFNWTMTYRQDSDIVVPYGTVQKITPKRTWKKTSLSDVWRKKTKSVVWMTSHCPTIGNRDLYVSHLKKYIDIDIYGSCGDMACAKNSTHECLQKFSEKYKFYLAFENSICKDYVTEKFFRTFSYNIIPVVFGGAEYEKYAPRGSYIDALSFHSPKHLASFLSGVGSDFNLYSAYFRWREDFVVSILSRKECDLCDLLHFRSPRKTVCEDIRKWWVYEGQCRTYEARTAHNHTLQNGSS